MEEHGSKYIALWICVLVAAGAIFAGWIYALKFNFKQINQEVQVNSPSTNQAIAEVQEMFDGLNNILKEQEIIVKEEKKTIEEEVILENVPEEDPLQAAGVEGDLK